MLSRAKLVLWLLLFGAVVARADSPLDSKAKVVALIFVSSECPISNKMAPEIERLHQKFSTNGAAIFIVYPNKSDSDALIQAHRKDYRLTAPFVRDPDHALVRKAQVTITPEAAVFDAARHEVYRGRINDQFLAIGKGRPQATVHDLEEAIEAALAGSRPKAMFTEAVGCYIQDQ
jgi:hypothetical protein